MLKQSKIILKSLTSFCWHPYWSCFISSLRNVRLNKIFERTYQDGTGVGLVDKEMGGVFGTNMCTYHKEKELLFPTSQIQVKKFKKGCKSKGIQVHFKGSNTLRTALGNRKDKDPKANQTGIIYHYQCPHINCTSSYIGESGRALGDRIKEHFKAPSPIHLHSSTTGHPMDPNQFSIVHKEVNSQPRTIKEAMFICMQDPPLNRNLGKYQLPHIWDHLLQASPTLQCKPANLPSNITSN